MLLDRDVRHRVRLDLLAGKSSDMPEGQVQVNTPGKVKRRTEGDQVALARALSPRLCGCVNTTGGREQIHAEVGIRAVKQPSGGWPPFAGDLGTPDMCPHLVTDDERNHHVRRR